MISGKSEAGDGWDGNTETAQFDWENEDAVTMAVVETVSSVTGKDPVEMKPLAEVIDSEALSMLFASREGTHNDENYAQFEYENCLVRVSGNGKVTATALD